MDGYIWYRCLQKERRGQSSVQTQRKSLAAILSNGTVFQMGHQVTDKVKQRTLKSCEGRRMKKACEKWVTACLSSCRLVKEHMKLKFPLQSIESTGFSEVAGD